MAKVLTFVFVLISITAHCQTDSVTDDILFGRSSKKDIISKGRQLLIEEILDNNKPGTKELFDRLMSFNDWSYTSLFPLEAWLIDYWLGNYESVVQSVITYDSIPLDKMYSKVVPGPDLLHNTILTALRQSRTEIENTIYLSPIGPVEKDFLILNLAYLLSEDDPYGNTQEALNVHSDSFLESHAGSPYEGYIRKYIRHVYAPSKWAFTAEFFSGYGIFTGQLTNSFRNNVPMGVAFDILYKRYVLFLRDYIGFTRTLDSLQFESVVWEKKAQGRVFLPEASLGFLVVDNEFIGISPFAGIASTSVSPTSFDVQKKPEYEDAGLNFTTTYTFGANVDLKFGRSHYGSRPTHSWFVRIRYGYNKPQFDKKYEGYSGNMHYITVGAGGFNRNWKRQL